MNVLLVEDSELVRREIERLLRFMPEVSDVVSCASVEAARGLLLDTVFDLWVLDFQLGDGTALDLLAERGEAVVVVVTAHPTPGIRERCLRAGAAHFLDKAEGLAGLKEALAGREVEDAP